MSTEFPPGWPCEVVILRLERYLLATLPLGESLKIAEHLEACVICAQHLVLVEPSVGRRG
jgi:Putative zinc-finger